jgi:hypothetical protein
MLYDGVLRNKVIVTQAKCVCDRRQACNDRYSRCTSCLPSQNLHHGKNVSREKFEYACNTTQELTCCCVDRFWVGSRDARARQGHKRDNQGKQFLLCTA